MIKAAGTTGLGAPLAFFGLSGENVTRQVLVLEDVVKLRAAVYSGHPDYRPEWATA